LKEESLHALTDRSHSGWTIGRVLPRLMLFAFVLDLVFRLVPIDPLTFRAWEAMLRRYPNAQGPFTPSKHFHRDQSYGGVAAIGNLRRSRRYHPVDFTTDALGYHNSPAPAQPDAFGLVLGDSFAVGSELPEGQSLSAQLTRLSGHFFYNAGAAQPLRLRSAQSLIRRLGMQRGVIIYEFLESHSLDAPPSATPEGARSATQAWFLRKLGADWSDRLRVPLNQWHESPFKALAVKLQKSLQNEVLLPNSFASFVIQEKLRNGDDILFLPAEFKSPADSTLAARRWAAYLAWYAAQMRSSGFDFVVLLVPNRSTIYAPFLAQPRDPSASREVLQSLHRELQRLDVPVVSLLTPYKHAAAELLPAHDYLYLLDDTHWNGVGTQIAAQQFLAFLKTSR
jgi:acetyltransferase AlgX (SGNH hydrolase-like protein)